MKKEKKWEIKKKSTNLLLIVVLSVPGLGPSRCGKSLIMIFPTKQHRGKGCRKELTKSPPISLDVAVILSAS